MSRSCTLIDKFNNKEENDMKHLMLGAVGAIAITLLASGANAADGSKLIAACKANLAAKTLPPGIPADKYMSFCQCLVTKAGNDQARIDEHLAIATAKGADVQTKISAASAGATADANACQKDLGITPAAPPQ